MAESIQRRLQTIGEEIANSISHGAGTLLAIAGCVVAIVRAALLSGPLGIVCACLYGASLILLYLFSTLYHSITHVNAKRILRIFDHCSIFILILGTYIPISLILLGGALGWTLFGVLTACAVVGIVLNAINLGRFKKVSMALYIIMGWAILFAVKPMLDVTPLPGLILLLAGGISYTAGVIFYKAKGKYQHFIWHLFVLGGSVLHYFFILFYCYT